MQISRPGIKFMITKIHNIIYFNQHRQHRISREPVIASSQKSILVANWISFLADNNNVNDELTTKHKCQIGNWKFEVKSFVSFVLLYKLYACTSDSYLNLILQYLNHGTESKNEICSEPKTKWEKWTFISWKITR
jgi:hypothetical protein